ARGQEAFREMGTDKSGSTGNKNSHLAFLRNGSLRRLYRSMAWIAGMSWHPLIKGLPAPAVAMLYKVGDRCLEMRRCDGSERMPGYASFTMAYDGRRLVYDSQSVLPHSNAQIVVLHAIAAEFAQ